MEAEPTDQTRRVRRGLLSRLPIRRKLILLHTLFTVGLTIGLLLAVHPTLNAVIEKAESESGITPLTGAREAEPLVYIVIVLAMLATYGLIAGALELFVLPTHVYRPIRAALRADAAVQQGEPSQELVPDELIPGDELGEIMRSRNASVVAFRRNEAQLAAALDRLEEVAGDLKRKSDLLETAQRNLADADRLASLGMMSAGIAHELNTPLAVVKGLAGKVRRATSDGPAPACGLSITEADLLVRVVTRIERLSESLLDFARAREPELRPVRMLEVVGEAVTLVRLDRGAAAVAFDIRLPEELVLWCDADRMIQVFVNLLRNAVDALQSTGAAPGQAARRPGGRVEVSAPGWEQRGAAGEWATIRVSDDGPGIDPSVLPRLFEPFVTRRLDDRGTGLGLAVAEGIVKEHGGTIIARNRGRGVGDATGGRSAASGAEFDVILPQGQPGSAGRHAGPSGPGE